MLRPDKLDCRGSVIWFTGLSGAGKTTLCLSLQTELDAVGVHAEIIDGDTIRKNLCSDLDFSPAGRNENVRRIAFIAEMLARSGIVVLVSVISPYRAARDQARKSIGDMIEVYVNAPLDICEARDTKGLYRRARQGEIEQFTGINSPYEAPLSPEIECRTDLENVSESTSKILTYLRKHCFDLYGI